MQFNWCTILAGAIKGHRRASAKEAEACVILYTLKKVKELELSKIHILLNVLCVVKGIQVKKYWSIKPVVQDILDVAYTFDLVDFSFIPRTFNGQAHSFG